MVRKLTWEAVVVRGDVTLKDTEFEDSDGVKGSPVSATRKRKKFRWVSLCFSVMYLVMS